ncbi:hypothetical protein HPC49_42155 [Pyxidicoccus fallax]|uniref:Uncharacterized protein n=1 Tax=Pyxidicoccus fallax TaxID=394095 RepID=A0A848LF37_9BACT|nr:hypothetical protein [Pyxidicoccus fallax]NMO17126.1 hypothetical protein [Pyxidicoccus fallax]NPC84809.1 hypothetical protein [Pyxidicoccus fallax]
MMEPPVSSRPRLLLLALGPGLVGATSLTLVHEGARRVLEHPPRMDVLGKRALKKGIRAFGGRPAHGKRLHQQSLAGDLVSNSLFYSLVALGRPKRPYLRGAVLGLLAGLGAVVLPPYLGLGQAPSRARRSTSLLTVAWYTLGGLAAARATRRLIDARPALETPGPGW